MIALLALCLLPPAAQDELEEEFNYVEYTSEFASELNFQEGAVELASGEASFDLPNGWAFLQAADARRVVEEFWGNPPDETTLGLSLIHI